MRAALSALALTAVLAASTAWADALSITKIQSRSMLPRAVAERVVNQLADLAAAQSASGGQSVVEKELMDLPIFANGDPAGRFDRLAKALVLIPYSFATRHPVSPLSKLYFELKPYATGVPALCATRGVTVEFEPVGSDAGAHTRVKASAVSVTNQGYRFLQPPASPTPPPLTDPERMHLNADCATIDPVKAYFIDAPDERQAIAAVWLARAVDAHLAGGRPAFGIGCGESDCALHIRNFRDVLDSLNAESCAISSGDVDRATCEVGTLWIGAKVDYAKKGTVLTILHVELAERLFIDGGMRID
jgi:hypothetical protein